MNTPRPTAEFSLRPPHARAQAGQRRFWGSLGLLLCLSFAGWAQDAPDPTTAARIAEGRAASQQLGAELKQALTGAIAEGGPIAAIEVCKIEAPEIAQRLSTDFHVGRTALRVRNPDNRADAAEQAVLQDFSARLADGEPAATLEHYAVLPDGRARYMKAIPTQPMCLTCHGASLPPAIAGAIKQRYPADEATGFAPGSLRGAFVVEWAAPQPRSAQ